MVAIRFGAPDPPVEGARDVEVPKARYTSREFLELEREHLWPKVWLVAGFACDVRAPGDYFVFELGHESILVVHDEKEGIAAFHNVCQHRGHALCDRGRGRAESFVCPYHGWKWGLDGSLVNVPTRTRFLQGLPVSRRQLPRVATRVWAGLVWVCLEEPQQSLEDYLGPIFEHVTPYQAEHMEINVDWTADWACNWKTAIDGFNETYHGPVTHPEFGEFLDTLDAEFQFGDRHSVFIIAHGVRPPPHDQDPIGEPMASLLRQAGVDPDHMKGKHDEVRAIAQKWVREQAEALGADLGALSDEQLTDTHHFYVFPNVQIDFHGANELTVQRFRPHPSDPDRCYLDVVDLKRQKNGTRAPHEDVPLGAEQLGIVYAQDIERLSRVQKGMHSRGFQSAHLSELERRIHHMHLVIDEFVGENAPPELRARLVP